MNHVVEDLAQDEQHGDDETVSSSFSRDRRPRLGGPEV